MYRFLIAAPFALSLAACSTNSGNTTRTLVTRPLTLGSPQNLVLDPFVGGELKGGWGHFSAGYDTGASVTMSRTFLSASPVGGAVSIELVPSGGSAPGASRITLAAPFLGGSGAFHADVWIAARDSSGAAVPFDSVASAVAIAITSPDATSSTSLTAGATQSFGSGQWAHFATSPDIASLPAGGWMTITLSRVDVQWMLAAPDVTSSSLVPASGS